MDTADRPVNICWYYVTNVNIDQLCLTRVKWTSILYWKYIQNTRIPNTVKVIWTWLNKEWYMYSSDELFQRSRDGYFGVYFPSCETTRGINTNITPEWAQKQLVTRVHRLFYFLHDNESINDKNKNKKQNISSPCLTRSVFVLLMTSP